VETALVQEAATGLPWHDGATSRTRQPVLVSYTRPWHDGSLIDFLQPAAGMPRVYWESERMPVGFAGQGVAAALMAAGPRRFQTIQRGANRLFDSAILEAVGAPPTAGPRLFGGFSFQAEHTPNGIWAAFPAAYFVLPRYQLTQIEGRNWLTVNRFVNCESGVPNSQLQVVNQAGSSSTFAIRNSQFAIRDSMDAATWRRLVKNAVLRIHHGELEKVVLARTCELTMDRPIDPVQVLSRLKRRYPNCYRFWIEPAPGHVFYGATPELLVEVAGSAVRTVAMAGSIGRGDSAEVDALLAQQLMTSPKERQEHAFVVHAVEAALHPLVRQLHVPEQPTVRRLHNIQHLQTIIEGELAGGVGVLSAVEALHPTPAVGGVPRTLALQMIAEAEPVSRGWYASPVGWMDSRGNGLFSVAIRSAVSVGTHARLYAGAGIVADSDPEREWEETGLKFRPMLEALE